MKNQAPQTILNETSETGRSQACVPRRKAGNALGLNVAKPLRDKVSGGVLKADTHGQVFTPADLVKEMLALRRNHGRVLEPSCGSGAFAKPLRESGADLVALELDAEHAPDYAVVGDFFDYPLTEQFASVIGNPPYLRFRDIPKSTRTKLDMSLFDTLSNLCCFFIEKSIRHLAPGGELIFVVPRDFPKATSARKMNRWLFEQGTITDFRETGDEAIFAGATPPCCIFRFEKGRMDRAMTDGRVFSEHAGQLFFLPSGTQGVPLSEFFEVAVGGLSGADKYYAHPQGNLEVVCSKTRKTGKTRTMFHGTSARLALADHKSELLKRRVRKFSDLNWWEWGRKWKETPVLRIYVNAKSRQVNPFFTHTCTAFDGSVLALFPKDSAMDIDAAVDVLNAVDWNALGFMAGERFLFAQRALEQTLIPVDVAIRLRGSVFKIERQVAA
jgi:adenine-specific DNA-methyltransferase